MLTFHNAGRTVVGIGSALVDILVRESDAFAERAGAVKGGMIYVPAERIDEIANAAKSPARIVSGGAACNTVVGIARLGGSARFVGKAGLGRMAAFFEDHLREAGVDPVLFRSSGTPTGRVLSVVTPDAQRSMLTSLGASAEMTPGEVTPDCFDGAAVAHVEGYLLFNPDLIRAALSAAKTAGARISLDLASFTVVESAGPLLGELVDEWVDILMANEDEARAFTGADAPEEALGRMAERVPVAVLKLGARGSRIAARGRVHRIAPASGVGPVVDTTGAGDLWAAGFLHGLVRGFSPEACGRLGSLCGYEVCQVMGADIPQEGYARIRADAGLE